MMTDRQKAWIYDNRPSIKTITGQDDGELLFEVRPTFHPRSIFEKLAGVGKDIEEAVANAMVLNPRYE